MNRFYHLPQLENTLHRPELERDSCGVGVVAQIHGERSNQILEYGITSLCNVVHRGAIDADRKTGDGAGILAQIPYRILLPEVEKMGESLEKESDLGVGMFFLPGKDPEKQSKARVLAEGIFHKRGLKVIGWREVPVNVDELGEKAQRTRPRIEQVLVKRGDGMDDDRFERVLYLVRREIELTSREELPELYIPSLSHRVVSYKALVVAPALRKFYQDLQDPKFETAICLYHQRFSTNTFPTWPLGQPFRMLAHNGEINTVRGNRNWMASREQDFQSEIWGEDVALLKDVIDPDGSDSASLDAALELLVLSGRSIPHAMSMLVPPAWRIDPETTPEEKAFFIYHRCLQEPWDGPAALAYTDGRTVAASLDRNGLRPARFKITEDGIFSLGSEVGTIELDDAKVIRKGRLAPGEMIVVDTVEGTVTENREVRRKLVGRKPYADWLKDNRVKLSDLVDNNPREPKGDLDILSLAQKQVVFDINKEEIDMILTPMIGSGQEPIYSMGDDAALSVLSSRPKLMATYFKQLFAQVTNPPIDPIRERLVMSVAVSLGWQKNLLAETPEHARMVYLNHPFLLEHELEQLRRMGDEFPARTIDITWPAGHGKGGLEEAIDRISHEAEQAADEGVRILILSDRNVDHERVPIPALMAVGAVHHHLNRVHKRMWLSLVVDSGEVRDTHSAATMFGFGAQAICPYLAYESIRQVVETDVKGKLGGLEYTTAIKNYRGALEKGVLKIMSKMGISVLSSYQGAQIFEAIGLSQRLVDRCFSGTPSQVQGVGFFEVAAESLMRHNAAFGPPAGDEEEGEDDKPLKLEDPGYNRFRRNGERHGIPNPILKNFHTFVRTGEPEKYESYVEDIKLHHPVALHDLFEFVPSSEGPVPLSEVEPIEEIRRRFTTAAMSLGALGPEAHETLAIAMNRIGAKSDSGEGGEDERRFKPYPNGDWANSKIKQVASGRFGVHTHYLVNAQELEIKMAQGAKPGEGGQLPGHKVNELIARLRHTQPGVTLISPPPHHDIYSIEDLAQLIHDLKEVNPAGKVCVKLVAETGVGTVAAGVAKANADVILISGHEGGTGASPLSSIKHAGLPWELGLAEAQQVLMLNGLRERVKLRTDGGLKTGRDIVTAAILGAEEYNFGTIAMIAMGCVYVRQCHLNTCPVGIATQDEKLRGKFKGKPEHVVNFFNAVSHEVRTIMAQLGVTKLDDLIGRPSFLRQREVPDHPKANTLDLSPILRDVAKGLGRDLPRFHLQERNDGIQDPPLDDRILKDAEAALDNLEKVTLSYPVVNTNRNVGTKLSGAIARSYGNHGMPDGTIDIALKGSAGQSLGTFLCGGVRLTLTGEANDYVGKGMCGGEIIIKAADNAKFVPAENSIMGNTVMYGATGGHLFANGRAGERFCVRNSGGVAVVEGVGDHGCEYMTNGLVIILGRTGKNFGAGMSGGLAFVYDIEGNFERMLNNEMVETADLEDPDDIDTVKSLIHRHLEHTHSARAREILDDWETAREKFRKVQPKPADIPGTATAKKREPKKPVPAK